MPTYLTLEEYDAEVARLRAADAAHYDAARNTAAAANKATLAAIVARQANRERFRCNPRGVPAVTK